MIEQEPHISNDLLAKYFAGEHTAQEAEAVETWAALSAENREQLEQLHILWLDTGIVEFDHETYEAFNEDLAWQKVKAKKQAAVLQSGNGGTTWFFRIAASVVVLLALGYLLKTFVLDTRQLEMLAMEEVKTLQLADGSTITLNKASALTYPSKFTAAQRTVSLRGEAFFEVEHNPEKPFVVQAAETTIEVLGTSFNVAMEGGSVEVSVETGKVRFSAGTEEMILIAGQRAVYARAAGIVEASEQADVAGAGQYWRTRRLSFAGHSLAQVVASLEEAFEVDIELENMELANCSLTVTFENDSLENMLDVIALTLELEVNRRGNVILLSGKGCPEK